MCVCVSQRELLSVAEFLPSSRPESVKPGQMTSHRSDANFYDWISHAPAAAAMVKRDALFK